MSDAGRERGGKGWPDYRAVWRWHFYAGLFCTPFVLLLSVTGAVYLFKPQVEAWNDRTYDRLAVAGGPAPAAEQVRAALAAVPGSTPAGYELPPSPDAAVRVLVRKAGETTRVYVHPETLAVLHTVPEDGRFMRVMFKLHGELLMGDRGSNLVELAASWTIVMLLTGLCLWWPRNAKGLGGVLYPRLRKGSRVFWRDLHAVVGVWVSCFALFLLLTGLPWAKFWGSYFKAARQATGTAVAQQDWAVGSDRPASRGGQGEHGGGHGGGHGGHGGGGRGDSPMPEDLGGFDRVAAAVRPLNLEHPVVIAPPARGSADWTAKSMTANRPRRVNLVVDAATGDIKSREDFKDRHLIDRIVGVGIAAHEGQLFGWPNQLLGLLTAAGLIALSGSGVLMWWRRRAGGTLGAPEPLTRPRFAAGLVAVVAALGVYLPLFGASLLAVLLVERVVLRRLPRVGPWLGLTPRPPSLSGAAVILLCPVAFAGCGGPAPVTGGTPGVLTCGGQRVGDIQLTLHRSEGAEFRPVGFAMTRPDGSFELLENGATGPLWLPPGDYVCTLESAGAPVQFPKKYADPRTTPLRVTWAEGRPSLDLDGPAVALR